MAALNADVKAFIVQALACFDTPSQVAEAVRAKFDITVSRQQVETHDPTKRCGKGLAKRWADLFSEARASFQRATIDVPIAHKAYRLRVLSRLLERAECRGDLIGALKLMEQAARECGDVYVARRVAAPVRAATRVDVAYVVANRTP